MVDTQGAVPDYSNSCHMSTHPWHWEQWKVLMLLSECSGLQSSD